MPVGLGIHAKDGLLPMKMQSNHDRSQLSVSRCLLTGLGYLFVEVHSCLELYYVAQRSAVFLRRLCKISLEVHRGSQWCSRGETPFPQIISGQGWTWTVIQ